MKVLITGGAGFIGSELGFHLSSSGHDVWSFDSHPSEELLADVDGNTVTAIPGDVLDVPHLFGVFDRVRPDVVVHAAAIVGMPSAIARPVHATKVNVMGAVNVFEAALSSGVRRFVDISSDEVYGDFEATEIDEDHPKRPNSLYGITKQTVESLGGQYALHYGLNYVAGRVSWVYGHRLPRLRPPQSWLKDALAGRRTVLESGGDQLLDMAFVADVVEGLRLLCEAERLTQPAYHLTSGRAVTLRELADEISGLVGDWQHDIGPGPLLLDAGIPIATKGALANDRARDELGFSPRFDLRAGLAANLRGLQGRG